MLSSFESLYLIYKQKNADFGTGLHVQSPEFANLSQFKTEYYGFS